MVKDWCALNGSVASIKYLTSTVKLIHFSQSAFRAVCINDGSQLRTLQREYANAGPQQSNMKT